MKHALSYCVTGILSISTAFDAAAGNWPAWRGPDGTGVSSEKNLPLHWSRNENVRWRIGLPEPCNSSPSVWGKRVFLTQALQKESRRTLMCLNPENGNLL